MDNPTENKADDFISIQDASIIIGKSVQTIRRMIKKGDLTAQQIKTAQGFHYLIPKSILQKKLEKKSYLTDSNESLTSQNLDLTSQSENPPIQNENPTSQSGQVLTSQNATTDSNPPIQNENPTSQNLDLTSQSENIAKCMCKCEEIEKIHNVQICELLTRQFEEKKFLYNLVDKLQNKLEKEMRSPKTFFAYLAEWWTR